MSKKKIDWIGIEGEYRSGVGTLRAIAKRYGLTESGIRAKAKKFGWLRNPTESKRLMVDAAMSGGSINDDSAQNGAHSVEDVTQRTILEAANQDVADMNLSLTANRGILKKAKQMVDIVDEPQPLKVLADAIKTATDTIRRIRKLDDAPAEQPKSGLDAKSLSTETLKEIVAARSK